jgi:hypothetical protein
MLAWKNWPSYLLCFCESPDTGVRCIAMRSLAHMLFTDKGKLHDEQRIRVMKNFMKDPDFPKVFRRAFHETNIHCLRGNDYMTELFFTFD